MVDCECLSDRQRPGHLFPGYQGRNEDSGKSLPGRSEATRHYHNTSDLNWSVDKQFRIITGNDTFWKRVADLTGKSEATITNEDFDPTLREHYIANYQLAYTEQAFSTVKERTLANGQIAYEQLIFNPIYDHQKVIGANCFLRDITN